jgi:hypothetical protein
MEPQGSLPCSWHLQWSVPWAKRIQCASSHPKSHLHFKLLTPFKIISPHPTPCVSFRILLKMSCQTLDQPKHLPTRRSPPVGCPHPLSQYTPSYTLQPHTSSPVPFGICFKSQTRHRISKIFFRSFPQELRAYDDTVPRLGHDWNPPQMPAVRTVLHTNVTSGLSRRGTTKDGGHLQKGRWLRYSGLRLALLERLTEGGWAGWGMWHVWGRENRTAY